MKNLNNELENMTEWHRAIIFDQNLQIKAKKNVETKDSELEFVKKLFR